MKRLKKLMPKIPKFFKNEKGQGATEYILLLVIVVAIAMLFKDRIKTAIEQKTQDLNTQIQGFTG